MIAETIEKGILIFETLKTDYFFWPAVSQSWIWVVS